MKILTFSVISLCFNSRHFNGKFANLAKLEVVDIKLTYLGDQKELERVPQYVSKCF